jgi:GDP-mannose 4,6-dehydratase
MRKFKKVFITGITGSGGSYLAEYINKIDKNIKIYGSYRSIGYKKLLEKRVKNLKLFKLDLRNFKKTKKIMNNVRPDALFHLASNADVRASFDKPIEFAENNNTITLTILESIRKLNLKTLIMICSTSEVYGAVTKKDIPISENQNLKPINPYAATKLFQDIISQIYLKSFKMNIVITRMFSYTNARRLNLFQTSFANQIALIEKKKKKFLSHGNLKSVRTFVDIDDAMEAYWLAATRGKIGEIYNIGGSKVISVKQFLKQLIKLSKVSIITKVDKKLLRPQDVTLQIPKVSKFRRDTGWKPKVSFNNSVRKLLNECRNFK